MAGTNQEAIVGLLTAWADGNEAAARGVRDHFALDCVWEQTGLPTTTGVEEAVQMVMSMEKFGFTAMKADFRNVTASGDVVCTERVDHVLRADGSVAMSIPVVGITEFRDGKISAWREYFDSAVLAQLKD
jgi:limonene-1,2-epoxide hydrolase